MRNYDVVIVGAGLSGISAAYYLQKMCPDKRFTMLESRESIGGTWDIFKFPGVRSDSDMFTYSYRFNPWLGDDLIASGDRILNYMRDTADKFGLTEKIQLSKKVITASWSSENNQWTLEVLDLKTNTNESITCQFLCFCTGYYKKHEGYTPKFQGMDQFKGPIIHPQHWDEELDYKNKKVIIIGSGATTMTLAPVMANDAAHVTVVQRSPTYVVSFPTKTGWLIRFWRTILPKKIYANFLRWHYMILDELIYKLSRRYPKKAKGLLLSLVAKQLDVRETINPHFNPKYNPWDERICVIANGDLFKQMNSGKLTVETDAIDCFTPTGLKMKSGKELDADIIVTATGFDILFAGNIKVKGGRIFSRGFSPRFTNSFL